MYTSGCENKLQPGHLEALLWLIAEPHKSGQDYHLFLPKIKPKSYSTYVIMTIGKSEIIQFFVYTQHRKNQGI